MNIMAASKAAGEERARLFSSSRLPSCATCLLAGPRWFWDSGLSCSLLASVFFSCSSLFSKLTGGRVPVLEVCLVRAAISAGLTLLLLQLCGVPLRLFFGQRRNRMLLLARGCCGAASMTTAYVALFLLPLGDAVTIGLIGPPVTALFARVLLKEPLGYRGLGGCLLSMGGVLLVAQPPFLFAGSGGTAWSRARAIGSLAGVASAVLGAGSSMTIRLIGASEPAAVIALAFHAASVCLTAGPLLAGFPNKAVPMQPADGGLMVAVAFTAFTAQLFSTRGLQRCQAAKAAAMGFTQVVYSTFFGIACFHDKPTSASILGTMLILAGVLLVTMRSSSAPAATGTGGGKSTAVAVAAYAREAAAADDAALDTPGALAIIRAASTRRLAADGYKGGADGGHTALDDDATAEADAEADAEAAAAAQSEEHRQLVALFAASAAAALGGELCPAQSTAAALDLSRQVSGQLHAAAADSCSQLSARPSQWLPSTPSRFVAANSTVLGLDVLERLPGALASAPAAAAQPAELCQPSIWQEPAQQCEQQPLVVGSPLRQALLNSMGSGMSTSRRRSSNSGGSAAGQAGQQAAVEAVRSASSLDEAQSTQ